MGSGESPTTKNRDQSIPAKDSNKGKDEDNTGHQQQGSDCTPLLLLARDRHEGSTVVQGISATDSIKDIDLTAPGEIATSSLMYNDAAANLPYKPFGFGSQLMAQYKTALQNSLNCDGSYAKLPSIATILLGQAKTII